ncbi:MAG: SHOCT domain-containing protein [Thermaerobacterales bacterium]
MLLFWLVPLLLAVGIFWLIINRQKGKPSSVAGDPDDNRRAIAILKERYAKGEISREDFQQMKEDLISR